MSLFKTHKESVNTGESCGTKDESDGESGDGEYGEEFDSVEDESDNEFVFNDLDQKSNPSQTIQFISDDQICEESKNNHYFSLRSKRFQSSYRAKVRAGTSQLFSTNSRGNACYAGYHYF